MNPIQGSSPYGSIQGKQTQFGSNAAKSPSAPKFGLADGGCLSVPCGIATCCAAPVAIPAILIGGFFLIKKLLGKITGK